MATDVDEPQGVLFGLSMPMAATLALQGVEIGHLHAKVAMPYNAAFTNSRGDVHGGVLSTLLDCTLASACRAHDPARYGVVTLDLTVHFLAPAQGAVLASAVCERQGRAMCFSRGQVHDAKGQLLALATGTFKLVERLQESHF
ncbi:PaaI family thioesterase [Lampropedia puyangensis]|uniref:PaaI family thioesterase n=1 Tax=Lampropedia puyangensis TaxID=1330072 RepID=A0A4S8FBT4_9BURK|nr:PaaI family thioesterase [Lampropedia puyangensis]THU05040.1 PaaI family thioesterase [Lampropedia puyangensis]